MVIPKPDGVLVFDREKGDLLADRTKIAPTALQGVTVNNAYFSPDGLNLILDCQKDAKAFLYRVPLILSDVEKALIKRGLPELPRTRGNVLIM